MAAPLIQPAFTLGEVSPELFGRSDLARFHIAAATFRNGFVNYRGGYNSRAGTKFVGFSKQTGRNYPPRLIQFQFNISQGLALEFGNYYMRVIYNGSFVLEAPVAITNATQANPCVITTSPTPGLGSATPVNTNTIATYAPGDTIYLAGGTVITRAEVTVTNTKIVSLLLNSPGTGVYAPADTIDLSGGTHTTTAVLTVQTTQVVSATVAAGGSGGTDGTQTVTGTTGSGTQFQASVTVAGGAITAVLSITVPGSYTANPTTPATEPVTGASLTGAQLNIELGVLTFSISNAGVFTANPSGATFTQATTSGSGVAATFKDALMGPNAVSVTNTGLYTAFPSNPVAQYSTSGGGVGVEFTATSTGVETFANGDWVYISEVSGMTELNGETYVVAGATADTIELLDVYGNNIDSTAFSAYTGSGTISRVFTQTTPYAEADLKYIKYVESADQMSLCCVNTETGTEYPPVDLTRITDSEWQLGEVNFTSGVAAPTNVTGSASSTGSVDYQYVVTSVDSKGKESVASSVAKVNSAVNIAATAGTITITWNFVSTIQQYNVYKATPGYSTEPPVGSLFGYAGTCFGTELIDSNITADFTQVPPLHKNPFSPGQVISVTPTAGGSGYTYITLSVTSASGSGCILEGVLQGGSLSAVIVVDPGKRYVSGDGVSISGDGTGAAAYATTSPGSGSYPSTVSYFQERRAYGNSLNNPDTYWMSQPGSFTNFDYRIPTIDSDAITGTPWSLEVNGIQFMVPTAGGLLVFTGLSNWLLVGAGSFATNVQPISPASQVATPQPENGCSALIPPIKVNYDVLYVSSKGSFYFDQPYQLYALSEPIDLTENSPHLFVGYTVIEHAWCLQPSKLLWSVRNDGAMLSLTFLKQQQVAGWARHDTQGLFKSVCSVSEPPVDALYVATQRFPGSNTAYMIERMDNREWASAEDCWCVDCGLSLAQPKPAATLTVSSATGLGACTGVTGLVGGANYSSATTASVVDDNGEGPGSGATAALTIAGGVITAVTFAVGHQGTNYVSPKLVITDPTNAGSGASATITLDNSADFTTSAGVFSAGDVGKVIRSGGGIATITSYVSSTHVVGNLSYPIVKIIPNSKTTAKPGGTPLTQPSGSWSMTAPVTTISGLNHLIGATVTGLADGIEIPNTVVPSTGTITLATAASAVTVGLRFQAQLQSIYLDAGEPTVQGQRKKIAAVTARVASSRGMKAGANQIDGSTTSPAELAPTWPAGELSTVPEKGVAPYNSSLQPLYTGDIRIPVTGGFNTRGQVCLQQDSPYPMNVLAFIDEVLPGDLPQVQDPKPRGGGQ